MFSSRMTGAGMRANAENSLIRRPIVSTWRMMVAIDLVNAVALLADLVEIFALQPLGGQANGGQRVLDLVRDAARDLGPGRLPLRRQQGGDVVEGHDVAQRCDRRRAAATPGPAVCAGAARATA